MSRLADRVKETSATTGTGSLALAGAVAGYRSFLATLGAGGVYYAVTHQSLAEWEVGIGTLTASPDTLARTTILASSNGGAATSFSAGLKDVFCTAPAVAFSGWTFVRPPVTVLSNGSATTETIVDVSSVVPAAARAMLLHLSDLGGQADGSSNFTGSLVFYLNAGEAFYSRDVNIGGVPTNSTWHFGGGEVTLPNVDQQFRYQWWMSHGQSQTVTIQVAGYTIPAMG